MMKRAENGQGSVSWTDLTEATNWEGDNESHSSGSSKTDDEEWALRVTRGAAGEMVCAVMMMLGMSGYSKRRNAKMEAHNDL